MTTRITADNISSTLPIIRCALRYNQNTNTVYDSFNVLTVTDKGTGYHMITFIEPMKSEWYYWQVSQDNGPGGQSGWKNAGTLTTGNFDFQAASGGGSADDRFITVTIVE